MGEGFPQARQFFGGYGFVGDYAVFGIFFVHWDGVLGFDRAVTGDRLRDISDLLFDIAI